MTKATAQMGGLTAEEIRDWRSWARKGSTMEFGTKLNAKFIALCDLALQAIDRWVPVSERLPGQNIKYLWALEDGEITCELFWPDIMSAKNLRATHWMALPPPPERP